MRAAWLLERDESGLRRALLAPLTPLSWIYGAGALLHRSLYGRGVFARRRLSSRVVSVGNLVVGGTGKTPLAAWIARGLCQRGQQVVLASRGYARADQGAVRVVSDGHRVSRDLWRLGDEPVLLAAHAPGVPVLVGNDRGLVGCRAQSAFDASVLVLDDGFQHHRLERDLDIVCFDGSLGFGNHAILPRGPLREPSRALRHADAIAIVDGPLPPRDAERLRDLAPRARQLRTWRRPTSLRSLRGGPTLPPESLRGLEVGMLVGTGLPAAFRRTLASLGAHIVSERRFPDHHRYRPRDLAPLARTAPRWVTTEKDALKIVPWWAGDAEVLVLRVTLEVEDAEKVLDWVEAELTL